MELSIESLRSLGWLGYVLGTVAVLDRFGLLKRKNGNGHDKLVDAINDLSNNVKAQTALLERLVERQDADHDILVKLSASRGDGI